MSFDLRHFSEEFIEEIMCYLSNSGSVEETAEVYEIDKEYVLLILEKFRKKPTDKKELSFEF